MISSQLYELFLLIFTPILSVFLFICSYSNIIWVVEVKKKDKNQGRFMSFDSSFYFFSIVAIMSTMERDIEYIFSKSHIQAINRKQTTHF